MGKLVRNTAAIFCVICVLCATLVLAPAGSSWAAPAEGKKFVVGFAQSRMNHPYRVAAVEQFRAAVAAKGLNWEVIVCDGQNDPSKQTSDVEDLITQGVDFILMSPITAAPLTPVAGRVMEAGIPLLLLDRTTTDENYTTYVGGDNIIAGVHVAQDIAKRANGAKVKVVEIQGNLGSSATTDRHTGFQEEIKKHPNIEVVADNTGDFERNIAMKLMEDLLQIENDIFAVYCHNDSMAVGAMTALEAAGKTGTHIYGVDGTIELFDLIKAGRITGGVIYPTGSAEAVDVIEKILKGEKVERKYMLDSPLVLAENMDKYYHMGF